MNRQLILTTVLTVFLSIVCAQNFSTLYSQEIKKVRLSDRPSKSDNTRIEVKLNGLVAIGIVNPAVEFKVLKKFTVQLEGFGSFATTNFLGTGKPFVIGATFGEFRYYIKKAFDGFYFGPNIGWGVYKLNKGLVLRYTDQYKDDCYQQGSNLMVGATIGYQFNIGQHWSIEVSWSGGFQNSVYEGFRRDNPDEDYKMYTGRNASAEWPPLYKGGIFVGYRF
ncbi:MAG: DUF3575 domain-containing protein [Bacteroidales bacterium]